MEVNRIKWDEEMNKRCMERIRYLSAGDAGAPRKMSRTSEAARAGRPTDTAEVGAHAARSADAVRISVRAIGVGEMMECKWIAM